MPITGVGIDGAGRTLVVERDVAAGDRRAERGARLAHAAHRFAKLEVDFGPPRIAEVEVVRDRHRPRAGAGDVARRFSTRRSARRRADRE